MPVEMRIWRIDGEQPRPLKAAVLPSESALEDFLEQDPSLLGTRLLVIGRQVRAPHGKFIDLLAIDGDGNLHVLEPKRDKTPRDVVAQVLDYDSWVTTLTREQVIDLARDHFDPAFDPAFKAAFEDVFGSAQPDELNSGLELIVVATDLDASSERIVTYLRDFGVLINAVCSSPISKTTTGAPWHAPGSRHPRRAPRPRRPRRRASGPTGTVATGPVEWLATRPLAEAHGEKGMFASQHSAGKLRQEFTLERLAHHFGLDDDD